MSRKAAVPAPPPATPEGALKARTKGLQILAPLGLEKLPALILTTPEDYLAADVKLSSLGHARAQWALVMEPIKGPLSRSIEHQKKALKEAQAAAQGALRLESEITSRLDLAESQLKEAMRQFKLQERKQLEEAEFERERKAEALRIQAVRATMDEAAAKTAQMRARLAQKRADLEAQAAAVDAEVISGPVKGAASTPRSVKVVRVKDPIAFLRAVVDYKARAGVYELGQPPLMVLNRKQELEPLVDISSARLTDLWREQPGIVESWPGVTVEDDILIAKK